MGTTRSDLGRRRVGQRFGVVVDFICFTLLAYGVKQMDGIIVESELSEQSVWLPGESSIESSPEAFSYRADDT